MGLAFSSSLAHGLPWTTRAERKVLLVGLDYVGKTSLLYSFPPSDPTSAAQTIATKGYNTRCLVHKGKSLVRWDLSGCHGLRPHWRYYFDQVDAVLFVVDPTDTTRWPEALAELERLSLHEPQLATSKFALLLHKSDLEADPQVCQDMRATFERLMRARASTTWIIEHTSCCKTVPGVAALQKVLDWLSADKATEHRRDM